MQFGLFGGAQSDPAEGHGDYPDFLLNAEARFDGVIQEPPACARCC